MSDVRPGTGQDHLVLTGRILVLAATVCLAGAGVAYVTGDEVGAGHGTWRTHMDAVLVLGTLAVMFVVASIVVHGALDRPRQPSAGRNDYDTV